MHAQIKDVWEKKLTETDVMCIRSLPLVEASDLAGWFRVSAGTIWDIRHNQIWKGIRPMAKKLVWKTLLTQHDKLQKDANATLYDRVTILAKIYEDAQYQKDMKATGKSRNEILDGRVGDTCANFTELLQILKLFPKRKQWSDGNLGDMRLKMLDKLSKKPTAKGESQQSNGRHDRKTSTLSQVRKLETELNLLKSEAKSSSLMIKGLEKQLEMARLTIGTLNETISILKMEGVAV